MFRHSSFGLSHGLNLPWLEVLGAFGRGHVTDVGESSMNPITKLKPVTHRRGAPSTIAGVSAGSQLQGNAGEMAGGANAPSGVEELWQAHPSPIARQLPSARYSSLCLLVPKNVGASFRRRALTVHGPKQAQQASRR